VTELAAPFAISLPAVSKHLKVLEKAGLISRGREAQWRPCRLEPEALKDVDDWVERYRALWEQRLDRLGDYLSEISDAPRQRTRRTKQTGDGHDPTRR
jgi:DNA-binding transcriptional ArsR family regulator